MENEETKKGTVHTFADDMATVIEGDSGSMVKKIIHEEEKELTEKEKESPEVKKNEIFLAGSVLFLIASLVILAFFLFKKDINTVSVEPQFVPLIFNDDYSYENNYHEIAGKKKDEIAQTVLNIANGTKVKDGGIEGIYLTENKTIVGLRRFIALIKSTFVPVGNPLFVSDNFLMGVEKTEVRNGLGSRYGFFILIKVRSAADIFDSIHAWENKMLSDLHGFFGIDLSSGTSYLFEKNFEDAVVENKSARILNDKDGKMVIMYVFADDSSVVITNSLSALHEVILRLASSQVKQ